MSHFSPVPPGEREYAKNYRKELEPFEAQLVEVSGRCKEFRDHPERKDLQSMLGREEKFDSPCFSRPSFRNF